MKIDSYKKINNSLYEVKVSDGRVLMLYDDIILKYELLLKKDLDANLLDKVIYENKYYEFYYLALKYIKSRKRSVMEVNDKLINSGCSKNYAFDILNKLIFQGYLNDSEYASSFFNEQILTTSRGPLKIKSELLKKGIEESIIDDVLGGYTIDIQKEKLKKIIGKKIKSNRNKSRRELKNKIVSELMGQGFSSNIIEEVYETFDVFDDDVYKREYEKLYKKLSRKYKEDELKRMVSLKMSQRGFDIS